MNKIEIGTGEDQNGTGDTILCLGISKCFKFIKYFQIFVIISTFVYYGISLMFFEV